jgi:hypothetical protein
MPNKHCTLVVFIFDIDMSMEQKNNVDLLRKNKKSILFNNREMKAIESYCHKYRINNRSKFMREAIITSILKKFDDDYPTLF